MERLKITTLLFLLVVGSGLAQNRDNIQKVEDPYRLFRGAILKTDLRVNAPVLINVEYRSLKDIGYDKAVSANQEVELRNLLSNPGGYANQNLMYQPAIVLDGLLMNDNSQLLNPVQLNPLDFIIWPN